MHRADLPREMALITDYRTETNLNDIGIEPDFTEERYTPLFYEEYTAEEFAELIKAQEEGNEDIYDET